MRGTKPTCTAVVPAQDLAKEPVLQQDLETAMTRIRPSVGAADVVKHREWSQQYGAV
jgi:hypothetical protein